MTLSEMETEVYEALGEQSDLDPALSAGAAMLDRWINEAYQKVCFWRFADGTQVNFPATKGEKFFQSYILTGTATSGAASTVTLDSSSAAVADRYVGWVIKITAGTGSGQSRIIMAYTAARVATVHEAWDTNPDTTSTYSLHKRFMKVVPAAAVDAAENIVIDPASEFVTALKVTDVAGLSDLDPGEKSEAYSGSMGSVANPTIFYTYGNTIFFDTAFETSQWYRLEYEKLPTPLTAAADEPQIPEVFHRAIVLHATWIGLKRSQDTEDAYSTKRDLQEYMASTRQPLEHDMARTDGRMSVLS